MLGRWTIEVSVVIHEIGIPDARFDIELAASPHRLQRAQASKQLRRQTER